MVAWESKEPVNCCLEIGVKVSPLAICVVLDGSLSQDHLFEHGRTDDLIQQDRRHTILTIILNFSETLKASKGKRCFCKPSLLHVRQKLGLRVGSGLQVRENRFFSLSGFGLLFGSIPFFLEVFLDSHFVSWIWVGFILWPSLSLRSLLHFDRLINYILLNRIRLIR